MELVKIAYGNDDPTESAKQTQALLQAYPNLKAIISPTTVGIQAAAQELQQEGKCGKVQLTGLGLPNDMRKYVKAGCTTKFGLWNESDSAISRPTSRTTCRRQAEREARPVVQGRHARDVQGAEATGTGRSSSSARRSSSHRRTSTSTTSNPAGSGGRRQAPPPSLGVKSQSKIDQIVLGTADLRGRRRDARLLDRFHAAGGRAIDLANVYGGGGGTAGGRQWLRRERRRRSDRALCEGLSSAVLQP